MGYFSELDLTKAEERADQSYHSFEAQLSERYDALKERYSNLSDADAPWGGDDVFSDDDYRYAPTEYFKTIGDVYRAMEIAKEDLFSKCKLTVRNDESIERVQEDDEEDPDQLEVFEIVLLPTWFQTAAAA